MIAPIFSSKENFRQHFQQGLIELLKNDELGVFILGLANASFDQDIYDFTKEKLLNRFYQLKDTYQKAILDGQQLNVPDDDLMVFLKLLAISIDHIKPTQFRKEGLWLMQFNHIRSLRPARMTQHKQTGINQPYDVNGFSFNKPFLQKEMFWQGYLLNKEISIFYNKFPFVQFHSLLVPDKALGLNQFLTKDYHEYIWQLTGQLAENLPGLGIAYNSYGAFASVNHLHFHLYIYEQPLPVMHNIWSHNISNEKIKQKSYPIQCEIFDNKNRAWEFIEQLHNLEIAYNLIYQDNKLYCLVRKHQSNTNLPNWCSGLGWYEMSGGFTTFNMSDFTTLTHDTLYKTLSELKITTIEPKDRI